MAKMIFVNLPVADVAGAAAFYRALGCEKNEPFSNDRSAAMTWSDTISFMLLDHVFYATFTPKPIADSHKTSGALFALSCNSRADVDRLTEAAIAAGGRELHGPEDLGFMYSRAFEDLDGHGFGPMWMDVAAMTAAMSAQPEPAEA